MSKTSRNGTLDTSFGTQGQLDIDVASGVAQLLPDGKILVFGTEELFQHGVHAYRYLADGQSDASFGKDGKMYIPFGNTNGESFYPEMSALTVDDKIILANRINSRRGIHLIQVVRIDQDGKIDTEWGADGKYVIHLPPGARDSLVGMRPLNNGKIIVLGNASQSPTAPEASTFARVNTDGLWDSSFGPEGLVPYPVVAGRATAFVALPDGTMFAGDSIGVSRFGPDAKPDPAFGNGGHAPIDLSGPYPNLRYWNVDEIAVQSDGKLALAGTVSELSAEPGSTRIVWFFRLLPNGSSDPGFNGGVPLLSRVGSTNHAPFGMVIQADGKIVIAGSTYGASRLTLERLNADGTRDATFGDNGIVIGPEHPSDQLLMTQGVALQPDGKILTTERSFGVSPARTRISRYLA